MKMFTKTQDKTIDRLLGAQGGRPGNAASLCAEFDADLASAYVERRLSASAVAGYESHLAACSPCRKSIIALTRLAQAEAAPAVATVERTPAISPVRRWLGALTAPQWAMAAAAMIVLAIALPLVLSNRATPTGQSRSTAEPANAQATAKAPAANPVQDTAATGG
jgi:predicted anti-sigma-YlaC factor YlaD